MMPIRGPLLTVEAAAEQLGISEGTMRNWLSAKRLEYVKVGRLTRIRQSAIDRFVTMHTISAVEDER